MKNQKIFSATLLIIPAWIFFAMIPVFSSQTNSGSDANEIKPERNIAGIECRLLMEKEQWQISEISKFKAYIVNIGDGNPYLTKLFTLLGVKPENVTLHMADIVHQNCQLKVDKQWYRYINPEWTGGIAVHNVTDWLIQVGAFMPISLEPKHWVTIDDSKPLVLEAGKHNISFGWSGKLNYSIPNNNKAEKPVLLESKAIQIEILKSPETSETISELQEHRLRVTDLYQTYLSANNRTEKEQKLGLKTNLITFNSFYPNFAWEDVPFLLELAKNNSLHQGMPSLNISSYAGQYCIDGMIALWLIEGIRRNQISLNREIQIGEKLHINSHRVPFNSVCIKNGISLRECEKSTELHKEVLQAYVKWWQTVGSLPAYQASAFHPLDLTAIEWYAGESYKDETLNIYEKLSSSGIIAEREIIYRIYIDNAYQPQETFQTVYYVLKNPDEKPPFTADKLKVRKIVLYYYDKEGKVIRTEDIMSEVK